MDLAWGSAGRRTRVAAVVSLVLLVVVGAWVPPPALPHSAGIVDQTRSGCSCHNGTESLDITPSVTGLPGYYEPGKVYDLNLSFDGGPPKGPGARAGFDLRASAGQLIAPEGSEMVRLDPVSGELTHTTQGNNATWWHVSWRAPEEDTGPVTLWLVVNVVNGDGAQTPGDKWGRLEVEVLEGGRGGISEAGAFWTVVASAAVIAIVGGVWYATRGPRIQGRG